MTRTRPSRLITLFIALLMPLSVSADSLIAKPPQIAASGYILMDAASGQVLVAHNADEQLPLPA